MSIELQHLLRWYKLCAIFCRAMHGPSELIDREQSLQHAIQVDLVEVRLIRLPLLEPFATSFGSIDSRLVFLVSLEANGLKGWGEVVAEEEPLYSYETVGTALHIIRDFLGPALLARPIASTGEMVDRFMPFRGHNMAKAGLELAFVDLVAQLSNRSISNVLGGTRKRVPVGVSLGIQSKLSELLNRVERYLTLGYQRIKLKIKPGWDIDIVTEVRRLHPDILLSVDANAAYRLSDIDHLKRLDSLGLLMIEQPLENDDLVDHAQLQRELKTPICLDESITNYRQAEKALKLGSCRMINIKVGRVGGYSQALAIHDLCLSQNVPVWCGGMLESGIGRAHNIALASLSGFTLPGDISASSRYFARDVIVPEVVVAPDGTVEVPSGVGLGFTVDLDFIENRTELREAIKSNR